MRVRICTQRAVRKSQCFHANAISVVQFQRCGLDIDRAESASISSFIIHHSSFIIHHSSLIIDSPQLPKANSWSHYRTPLVPDTRLEVARNFSE
jgi:hypothetical protein